MAVHADNLIWIDLEMTGLDPDRDWIIEIATVVTDKDLNELAEGPVLAIHRSEQVLNGMDEWNMRQHTSSGLWDRVIASDITVQQAEEETLDFLNDWIKPHNSPMCGNTICQDRRFMYRLMPSLETFFHYRNLDVSTLKELVRRWCPHLLDGFKKQARHLALEDIRDSIEELRYYRQFMGKIGGMDG